MRDVLAFWALPLVVFWGWYFLSLYNIHFGYVLLTRQAHDLLFDLYGDMIGVAGPAWFNAPAGAIPARKTSLGHEAGRVLPGE